MNDKTELCAFLNTTNIVCHYTKSAVMPLIIKNGMLFHRLNEMNDIFETTKRIFFDTTELVDIEEADVLCELNRYSQISFCTDSKDKRAFMLWQMWGHYAEDGKGVCIVLDKSELEIQCGKHYLAQTVNYDDCEFGNIILNQNPKLFFESNPVNIFFTKNKDWAHEREYRVIGYFNDDIKHYLQIDNCIKCVVALKEQPSDVIDLLSNHNIPLLTLSNFLGDWQLTDSEYDLIWSPIANKTFTLAI